MSNETPVTLDTLTPGQRFTFHKGDAPAVFIGLTGVSSYVYYDCSGKRQHTNAGTYWSTGLPAWPMVYPELNGAGLPNTPEQIAAVWLINMEDGPERRRLYAGHKSRRVDSTAGGIRVTDHGPADEWLVQEHAADIIRDTPELLSEARGWIGDAFESLDTAEFDTSGVIAMLQRNYDGGCAEFLKNSAALIPAGYVVGQHVKLHDTHPGDGGWSTAYVESLHGSKYAVRVQGHSLYYVTAAKLSALTPAAGDSK